MAAPTISNTVRSTANSTNAVTITKPTGTVSGDLLVCIIIESDATLSTNTGYTIPSGWTQMAGSGTWYSSARAGRVGFFYKQAGASEPANYTFTMPTSSFQDINGTMCRVPSGEFDTTTPIVDTSVAQTSSGTTVSDTYSKNSGQDVSVFMSATHYNLFGTDGSSSSYLGSTIISEGMGPSNEGWTAARESVTSGTSFTSGIDHTDIYSENFDHILAGMVIQEPDPGVTGSGGLTTGGITLSGEGAAQATGLPTGGGAGGSMDIGRWTGTTGGGDPSTGSWAAPNGMFATQARNDNSVYSFNSTTSTLTLPSSDLADGYLILASYEYQISHNNRDAHAGRIIQASGTGNFEGSPTSGYARNSSNDLLRVFCWAFVDSPSASATFQFQWKREVGDGTPAGAPTQSRFEVIPFWYTSIGMYGSTTTARNASTTPADVASLTATYQSDTSAIELISGDVTAKNEARYLALGAMYFEGLGGRTQQILGFREGASNLVDTYNYYYSRDTGTDYAGAAIMHLFDIGVTDTEIMMIHHIGDQGPGTISSAPTYGSENGGAPPSVGDHSLVLIELPAEAEVIQSRMDNVAAQTITSASPIDINVVHEVDFNDSASFTKVDDNEIDATVAMDAFCFGSLLGEYTSISGTRHEGESHLTINGLEQAFTMHGNYGRGDQSSTGTFGYGTSACGVLALSAGNNIGFSANTTGNAGPVQTVGGHMFAINMDTLVPDGGVDARGNLIMGGAALSGSGTVGGATTGSGNLTMGGAQLDGTGERTVTGSGALTTGPAVLASTGERTITASGALLAGGAQLDGTGARVVDGSGALAMGGAFLASTGEREITASGALQAGGAQLDGTGEITKTGSGNLTMGPAVLSSTGERTITGSGALAAGGSQLDGTGARKVEGSGALALGGAFLTSTGEREISASGALTLGGAQLDGTGERTVTATGALLLGGTFLTSTGERLITASGGLISGGAQLDGIGAVGAVVVGSGALTLGGVLLSSTGERTIVGSGGLITGGAQLDGTGEREITGSGALQTGGAQLDGTGEREVTGAGALTMGGAQLDGTGNVFSVITGTGALAIGGVSLQGSGEREIDGTGALTIGAALLSGTGQRKVVGSGGLNMGAATLAGAAERIILGSGGLNMGGAQLDGIGAIEGEILGTGSLTIGGASIDATGLITRTGSASLTIGGVQIDATGFRTVTGTGSLVIGGVQINAIAKEIISGSGGLTLGGTQISAIETVADAIRTGLGRLRTEDDQIIWDEDEIILAAIRKFLEMQNG